MRSAQGSPTLTASSDGVGAGAGAGAGRGMLITGDGAPGGAGGITISGAGAGAGIGAGAGAGAGGAPQETGTSKHTANINPVTISLFFIITSYMLFGSLNGILTFVNVTFFKHP